MVRQRSGAAAQQIAVPRAAAHRVWPPPPGAEAFLAALHEASVADDVIRFQRCVAGHPRTGRRHALARLANAVLVRARHRGQVGLERRLRHLLAAAEGARQCRRRVSLPGKWGTIKRSDGTIQEARQDP